MDKNMVVPNDKYIFKDILLTDENGDITYKVIHRSTGVRYCLKSFNPPFDLSDREQIQLEFQTLKQLDHPTLLRCHDLWESIDGKIHVLLDYVDKYDFDPSKLNSRAEEDKLANIAKQLLQGLEYLHSKQIWHGGVKNSNIFVDLFAEKFKLKVLYLERTLTRVPLLNQGLHGHDNFSWDVWNLGFIILKFFMGPGKLDLDLVTVNVEPMDDPQSHSLARGKSIDIPSPDVYLPVNKRRPMDSTKKQAVFVNLQVPVPVLKSSKDFWDFLRCCMHTDLLSRWNATRLLKHPFISGRHVSYGTRFPFCFPPYRGMHPLKLATFSPKLSNLLKTKSLSDDILPTRLKNRPSPTLTDTEIGADTLDAYNKCIQHCFLFAQDFEFDMDKVVQLWIAEGCINEEERMEDVAKSYFEDLVNKEFMIPQKLDIVYGKMIYKLNISKFLNWSQKNGTDGDYLRVCEFDMDEILKKTAARHLSFHCATFDPKIFDTLKDFKQLRTLLLFGCRVTLLPNAVLLGLKLLRSLDLSFTSISELPNAVGNLESLRCLDVSETPIRQLPESTDRLSFLQTLRLRGCVGVHSLPKKLEKLINLRHLDIDIFRQLDSMPKGMGSLIKLQTLHAFLVGNNDRCGIEELENLNNITGSFCISGLDNVSSLEKAKQAMLGNKTHLDMLELRWSSEQIHENSALDVEILESLQPHFGIKELKILCYKGSKLPCWISNPSFNNLANITLYKCLNCHILPCIGELPSLKNLTIVEMDSLRDIDSIFCRDHGNLGSGAFPSLEKLTLTNMLSLEKWSGIESGDFLCLRHIAIRYCPKLSILPVMSHLCRLLYLEISHCSQLISLPEGRMPNSLESLIIRDCPNICGGCIQSGQDRCKIAHVANIWIDFKKISFE